MVEHAKRKGGIREPFSARQFDMPNALEYIKPGAVAGYNVRNYPAGNVRRCDTMA